MAVVNWIDLEGKPRTVEVNTGSVEDTTVFTTSEIPASVEMTAIEKGTNKQLMLNNVQKLIISPSQAANLVTVNIGQGIVQILHSVPEIFVRSY